MINLLKIGFILLSGFGVGFGVNKLAESEIIPNDANNNYGYMYDGYCHDGDNDSNFFLEHMLENLSDEDQVLVQAKVDELLVKYSITLEDLNDNRDVRYDFMNDLMTFLDDQGIDYHSHGGFYNRFDDNDWHGGMGMH